MIQRIIRAVVFAIFALIGMTMALIFTVSTVIAITILFIVSSLRGKPFAAKEYWTNSQTRRKSLLKQGPLRARKDDVMDVDARDVPRDPK